MSKRFFWSYSGKDFSCASAWCIASGNGYRGDEADRDHSHDHRPLSPPPGGDLSASALHRFCRVWARTENVWVMRPLLIEFLDGIGDGLSCRPEGKPTQGTRILMVTGLYPVKKVSDPSAFALNCFYLPLSKRRNL